jgi:hypothetical protein
MSGAGVQAVASGGGGQARGQTRSGLIFQIIRFLRKARFWSLASVALASAALRRLLFGPARPSWHTPPLCLSFLFLSNNNYYLHLFI